MKPQKPTYHYTDVVNHTVGQRGILFVEDNNSKDEVTITSVIKSYDERTGRIETECSIYVPVAS
jgi:hypothetical protein